MGQQVAAQLSYARTALSSGDFPRIGCCDATYADLKYAAYDGVSWSIETEDSLGDVGQSTSLAMNSNDYPHFDLFMRCGGSK